MATRATEPSSRPYDGDTYGWALDQAALLRARRFGELDCENLADEIESVGKSEYRELESALRGLLLHLLKWHFQPEKRGNSWRASINIQRRHAARAVRDNPSLKPRWREAVDEAYADARDEAIAETGLDEARLPAANPFSDAQIMDAPLDEAAG